MKYHRQLNHNTMRFFSNHDKRKFLLRRSIPRNFTSSTVKGSTIRLQEAKSRIKRLQPKKSEYFWTEASSLHNCFFFFFCFESPKEIMQENARHASWCLNKKGYYSCTATIVALSSSDLVTLKLKADRSVHHWSLLHTHTQMYIKLASTDTKNRVFVHVIWQIIWQNLKLMIQYAWAKWVLPVNLRPIVEISSAPSIGASMSDINQCSRVFYHKPGSNGKELNKEIQRPNKQKRKKYKSKIFQGQCGLSKHLPTHFKKQYKQSIWRFQRQKFQTRISDW